MYSDVSSIGFCGGFHVSVQVSQGKHCTSGIKVSKDLCFRDMKAHTWWNCTKLSKRWKAKANSQLRCPKSRLNPRNQLCFVSLQVFSSNTLIICSG